MTEPTGYVIRVLGWNLNGVPCPVLGQYVEWYDPHADAWGGAATFGFTDDLEKAKAFPTQAEAANFYRQPLLDDDNVPRRRRDAPGAAPTLGGVERPLTAFSVDFPPITDDKENNDDQPGSDGGAGEGNPPEAGSDAG